MLKKAALASILGLAACNTQFNSENELTERSGGTNSSSWQNVALVENALSERQAVRVNLRTNYATYYENGQPLAKWKVASGRPGHGTPRGIFRFHHKEVCPPWNNGRGRSAGACAPNNPLGKKALWFAQGRIYGLHGVDSGNIASVTADNPRSRDRSSGCVRNHPENIEWLFQKINVGAPVVVGAWENDPVVVDCSGDSRKCESQPNSTPENESENTTENETESTTETSNLLPTTLPTWCAMNVTPRGGVANVRSSADTSSEIISQLVHTSKVKVLEKVEGSSVNDSTSWYAVSYTLGGEKSGFLHESLLDCTR